MLKIKLFKNKPIRSINLKLLVNSLAENKTNLESNIIKRMVEFKNDQS